MPLYQQLVGCLLYLAVSTHPDISFYAMWLGQFNAAPTRNHLLIAKHVLRYLAGTKTLSLCLGSPSPRVPTTLSGYMKNIGCSDADWASDAVDQKSISGYSFFFQGSLVSWSAVKQKAIALSSTEAEYYAMAHAFKEALWLCSFLSLLKLPVPCPFPILTDNQATCLFLTHLRYLLVPNTLTSVTIFFVITFRRVHFLLPGCRLQICLRISLLKLFLFLPSHTIMMFWVYPFLLLLRNHLLIFYSISFSFLLFPFSFSLFLSTLMGVCWR